MQCAPTGGRWIGKLLVEKIILELLSKGKAIAAMTKNATLHNLCRGAMLAPTMPCAHNACAHNKKLIADSDVVQFIWRNIN